MEDDPLGWEAVGELYHRLVTGYLLTAVNRGGRERATELVFRVFRRQQQEKFLPGLAKLGLGGLPPAVACAQYHYLSNALGGVKVEWLPETDRKSWVRYLPPRWIFDGTAVCAVPTEVSRAMLWGWHANNGVLLGNLRLGFVCTKLTTDAEPGLEGYYVEEDRELAPDERLRFSFGEPSPPPAALQPAVDWPADRLAKVSRNYAMEYVRSLTPELATVFGPLEGAHLARVAGRQVGMQLYDTVAARLGPPESADPAGFARLLGRLLAAQGDEVEVEGAAVRQHSWRVMRGLTLPPEAFEGWNGVWEGMAALHGDALRLSVTQRLDLGDPCFEWRVSTRRPPARF